MNPTLPHTACFPDLFSFGWALSATGNTSVALGFPARGIGHLLLFSLLFWSLPNRLFAEDIAWLEDSVISQARKAVVMVNPRQGVATTGFFVSSDGWVLTSAATLEGLREVVIITAEQKSLTGSKLVAMDPLSDLAILVTGMRPVHFLEVPDHPAVAGDSCAVILQNGEGSLRSTDGILLAQRDILDWTEKRLLRVWSVALRPDSYGITGAPVITREGKVAGMCDFISGKPPQKFVFAIPDTAIAALLKRARLGNNTPASFPKAGEISGFGVPSDADYAGAMKLLSAGNTEGALQGFLQSLKLHPDNPIVLRQAALCYANTGRLADGSAMIDKALQLAPARMDLRAIKGQFLGTQGDHQKTVAYFQQLTASMPAYGTGWGRLSESLLRADRVREALQASQKWTQLEPDSIFAWNVHAVALSATGAFEAAAEATTRAEKLEKVFYTLRFSAPRRE